MQPISCQLQSFPSNSQTVARDTVCCNGRSVSTVTASPVVYPDNQTRGSTLSDYRVCQFAKGAMQIGNSLMRSVAGFAFQQVMDSPEIGLVCPGLKESLVALLALPTMVSGYPLKGCGDGQFQCDGIPPRCIPENWKCNGYKDCIDKTDEESCPLITQCEVKDAFLCNNSVKCIPRNKVCDLRDDCGDRSDEPPKLTCRNIAIPTLYPVIPATPTLTQVTPVTTSPTPLTPATTSPTPLPPESSTGDTSLPAYDRYLHAAPFFGVLGICGVSLATYYCIAVYRSVKAMRCTNPEASACQLLQMALKQPYYFRYPHQPAPIGAHQDAIVRPASPELPRQRPEAQQGSCQQAAELPSATELPSYQQATGLPTYQQATQWPLPTYEEAITETYV